MNTLVRGNRSTNGEPQDRTVRRLAATVLENGDG